MAQFYTLDEAARVLGMDPEELKAEAQQRKVRAFLDGGTWRFRVGDVDELARRRGMGSDAELPLSDLDLPPAPLEDIDLSEYELGVADPDLGTPSVAAAGPGTPVSDSGDRDMLIDDLSLPPTTMTSSSVIIGMQTAGGRMPSDSDVRLIPDNTSGSGSRPSDSDVRLAPPEFKLASDSDVKPGPPKGKPASDSDVKPGPPKGKPASDSDVMLRHPSDSDVTLIAGDSSVQDSVFAAPGGLGDTAVRKSPLSGSGSGSSAEVTPGFESDSDSDFDLTPSSIEDALEPDSGSDFELSALEGSDEFEATPLAGPSDSDVTAADPGFSGINLSRPSDSGINLQMASGLGLGGAESMELAPLSGSNIKPVPAAPGKPKPSLARTPPPSRAKGSKAEKDIFDDTDFEVDALDSEKDSDDRTMQLEAASDFELEDADTGSEVFAIDEEDVDQNAATALGPAGGSVAEDEEDAFGGAAVATGSSGWDVESEAAPAAPAAGRAAPGPVLARDASPEWGGLWVGMLGFATLLMLFLTFVSLDLVRNLYDFRGDSPASGIVKSLAGLIGG